MGDAARLPGIAHALLCFPVSPVAPRSAADRRVPELTSPRPGSGRGRPATRAAAWLRILATAMAAVRRDDPASAGHPPDLSRGPRRAGQRPRARLVAPRSRLAPRQHGFARPLAHQAGGARGGGGAGRDAARGDHDAAGSRPGDVLLGGFSQGGMVSAEIAFRSDTPLKALILLSPTVVDEPSWRDGIPLRRGLPVFIAHGRQDEVLPFSASARLAETLRTAGLSVTWVPFDGGHDIPRPVVDCPQRVPGQRRPLRWTAAASSREPRLRFARLLAM